MVMKLRFVAALLFSGSAVLLVTSCASNGQHKPMLGQRVGAYVDDAYLTSAIKTKLLGDIALKSFDIHVTTKSGIVTLSGSVPNTNLRDEAIKTAKSVGGVKDVISDIKIVTH